MEFETESTAIYFVAEAQFFSGRPSGDFGASLIVYTDKITSSLV